MNHRDSGNHRAILREIAHRVMLERDLAPDFSKAAVAETNAINGAAACAGSSIRDLRGLAWCSIDNDDSRDLDQLSVAEATEGERVTIRVAIADVDALVKRKSAIDDHARQNTTSVYTDGGIFPMLPERLSTDLTSLSLGSDRLAVVVEMDVAADGSVGAARIFRAVVRNRAKLAYGSCGAWLEGAAPMPPMVAAVPGLADNLRLQDQVARRLRAVRHARGALDLQTIQTHPEFEGDRLKDLTAVTKNRANDLIEDFMIAANSVTARRLESEGFPSMRRVVRTPKRWDRIQALASERGGRLPNEPDSPALEQFLRLARASDPIRFADLSLCVIKLLGSGEYVIQAAGEVAPGHFGLAVKDYAHSTAPNRRFPDVITQRLLKAALAGEPPPYDNIELRALARHCTEAEDSAKKVERQVGKSAAALLLSSRIGERFDAIVTGAASKGTWVRIFDPPIEGKLEAGFEGVDVGQRLRVQLMRTDIERGYIDFQRVS